MGTLALGYGFGNGIRVELEGSIRANAVDSARGFAPLQPLERAQGELWNYGVMANAFVDLNLGQPGWVQPYLGLGLGYVHTELTNFRVNGNSARLAVDSSDGSLAYQAIAGAAFPDRGGARPLRHRRVPLHGCGRVGVPGAAGRCLHQREPLRRGGRRWSPTTTPSWSGCATSPGIHRSRRWRRCWWRPR
jgi:hypothetical protein